MSFKYYIIHEPEQSNDCFTNIFTISDDIVYNIHNTALFEVNRTYQKLHLLLDTNKYDWLIMFVFIYSSQYKEYEIFDKHNKPMVNLLNALYDTYFDVKFVCIDEHLNFSIMCNNTVIKAIYEKQENILQWKIQHKHYTTQNAIITINEQTKEAYAIFAKIEVEIMIKYIYHLLLHLCQYNDIRCTYLTIKCATIEACMINNLYKYGFYPVIKVGNRYFENITNPCVYDEHRVNCDIFYFFYSLDKYKTNGNNLMNQDLTQLFSKNNKERILKCMSMFGDTCVQINNIKSIMYMFIQKTS